MGCDHYLLVSYLKIKFAARQEPNFPRKKFNVLKLEDSKMRQNLQILLRNRFEPLLLLDNRFDPYLLVDNGVETGVDGARWPHS